MASWLRQVSGDPGGSPVAAAGDLDGRISAQGFPNDEAVVASRRDDGTLQVSVLDYNVAPGEAVETAPGVALPATGPGRGARLARRGGGDFDNDGQNEIAVLWQGDGCRIAGPASRCPTSRCCATPTPAGPAPSPCCRRTSPSRRRC